MSRRYLSTLYIHWRSGGKTETENVVQQVQVFVDRDMLRESEEMDYRLMRFQNKVEIIYKSQRDEMKGHQKGRC